MQTYTNDDISYLFDNPNEPKWSEENKNVYDWFFNMYMCITTKDVISHIL